MRKLRYALVLFALLVLVGSSAAGQENAGDKYAKLDSTRIHYQSTGKGKDALVLIHGWGGSLNLWRDHVPELSKRARVIAVDLPGHGMSDKTAGTYTIDQFAAAIDAVMRDAKVKRAVLVGHSMGTPVVRQFYRKYPQKTLGIVIVDGALRSFGDKAQRDQFVAAFKSAKYKEAGAQMFAAMTSTLSQPDKDLISASWLNTPQNVLVGAMESMNDDALYTTDKINVPVLAILAKSPYWPADTEQFLRSLAPDLEFTMWEGVSHFLFMDRPKEFDAAVIAFLDKKNLLK